MNSFKRRSIVTFIISFFLPNVTLVTAVVDNQQDDLSDIGGNNRALISFEALIKLDGLSIDSSNGRILCGSSQSKRCSFPRHDRREKNINEIGCERIELSCSTLDQQCSKESIDQTYSCPSCSSFNLSSIVRGVQYRCQLSTTKRDFPTVVSGLYTFNTSLQSMLVDEEIRLNRSQMSFTVTNHPRSDFDSLRLDCVPKKNQTSVCSNVTLENARCSTTFTFPGTAGCDYQCSIDTVKSLFSPISSKPFQITVDPLKPVLSGQVEGSRRISLRWTFEDVTNIPSFDLYQNNRLILSSNATQHPANQTQFSQMITEGLLPDHTYEYFLRAQSNREISSDTIVIRTDEEGATIIEQSIVILPDHPLSSPTRCFILIDRKLLSTDNGTLLNYLIYVRQNQENDFTQPHLDGTYSDALRNQSIDYLALDIPLATSASKLDSSNISFLLGNDTSCSNNTQPNEQCNGPLKSSTKYRILVGGCKRTGCTYVLSRTFQTATPVGKISSSLLWLAGLFVLLALVVVSLLIWKGKAMKNHFWKRETITLVTPDIDLREMTSPPVTYTYGFERMRPKPLSRYINISIEDELTLREEFQELKRISARFVQSTRAVQLIDEDRLNTDGVCFLHDVHRENKYIAWQTPSTNTVPDFWEMILHYRVLKIVMLDHRTHHPSSSTGNFSYIPLNKGQSLEFGTIKIQTTNMERLLHDALEIRSLRIEKENETLHVLHYCYKDWSESGLTSVEKLLDFMQICKRCEQPSSAPIVVHYSSGMGHAGIFIAMDIILHLTDQADDLSNRNLDIMGIVNQLRLDTSNIIQTEEHYLLLHRCVEEYLRRTNPLNRKDRRTGAPMRRKTRARPTNRDPPLSPTSTHVMSAREDRESRHADDRMYHLSHRIEKESSHKPRSPQANPACRKNSINTFL